MDIQQRRPRRTNQILEKDILEATRQEVIENGFANLTIVGIAKRAKIEPSVFYKRYKDLYSLLEDYVQKYDYWHTSLTNLFNAASPVCYETYLKDISVSMIKFLHEDKSMQELILWELTENNAITRNSNMMREESTKHIVEAYEKYFRSEGIHTNPNVFSAIILSAIYFLIIHKGKFTFCGIDFSTNEGRELLTNTITDLIKKVFKEKEQNNAVVSVIKKMKAKGIDITMISECTGFSAEEINKLIDY